MMNLLEKSRALNRLLQDAESHTVEYGEMARVLGGLIGANIYVTGQAGRLLGHWFMDGHGRPAFEEYIASHEAIAESHNAMLLRVAQTALNVRGEQGGFAPDSLAGDGGDGGAGGHEGAATAIVPIIVGGERQGTLVLARFDGRDFGDEDAILAEHGAMMIGMEILRERSAAMEEEARQRAAVQVAIGTLSYSELEAIEQIFAELEGTETLLIASKIADRAGITRSVIVNALRKFESAGVIETKSLGMKGTFIRVLNDHLVEELKKRRTDAQDG